ncbi:metal ABC transporter solute-binding protein, Zn/Mn family [Streptacidiphilus jiangxiensis]|uniref:Zinc/manganese transport system substrate-binding protein n=1 Tax=Streptacidiphilus jiangxiensis TaxID=235985 RepID=A0A1H7PU05_STRJI|nr:zinc ABC transporter substrate-binding protein [Streptacidiphilus jiangxiensis]SEL38948.1 zinc/manganese transport system substrate-binding protein [Streptacidiphilus jiangxiensis]
MRSSVPSRPTTHRRLARTVLGGTAIALVATVSACATTAPAGSRATDGSGADAAAGGKVIQVVAAENFWGSIAAQLGGSHVHVTSIITNPDTDPHSYEPTAADARTVTTAQYAIVNGIGYDAWADKLLATNPGSGRTELKVGDLVGIQPGGNPHRWYSPTDVHQVIEQITADYKKIDPADAAWFDQQKQTFETQTLARYNQLISDIRAKYAGTPIGASESIVTPLAEGLGLKMATPETFLDAMSEGTDPTAADKALIDQQIRTKQIKVYVYNSQNSTPDVVAQVKLAKSEGIPVATVTETLAPAGDTFQQWQTTELQGIEQALHQATGK